MNINRETIEQYILLEQSGEITPAQQSELDGYLIAYPEAASFRNDLNQLTQAARQVPLDTTVSEMTFERIMQEAQSARKVASTSSSSPSFRFAAVAAALLALFTAWQLFISGNDTGTVAEQPSVVPTVEYAWSDGIDEEISTLETMFSMTEAAWQTADSSANEADPDDLARELLALVNPGI